MSDFQYASGCQLPDGAEVIETGGMTVLIGDKHGVASVYSSAPKRAYLSTGTAKQTARNGYGYGFDEDDEWYWSGGKSARKGGRKIKRKTSRPKTTRNRKYSLPATSTTPLNWIRRDKPDWEVLEFEYSSLVQAARSKAGNKDQKAERVRQATNAFRSFVMVATLLVDNDRPQKDSTGALPSYNEAWDHICISLGARFMLANLASFVAENGGKKIAHHMINALFCQSWKLSEDSFMAKSDPVERPLTSVSSGGIYSGRVQPWVVEAANNNDLERIAAAVMEGTHNHAESIFKARIGNGEEADNTLQNLLWTAYSSPTVLTAVVAQVFFIVSQGKKVTLGEIVDIIDLTFMSSVAGTADSFEIEDHEWIETYRSALEYAGLTDVLAKIIHFVIDIGESDVVKENLTNGGDDDKIEVQETGTNSGL